MGRSFSVFLFCFAMDPLFHYLNRIPHVLSVQAYVDTTLVGDAQNTQWIQKVAQCYDDVRTAGFVVDSHSCYRSISNSTMRFGPTTMSSAQLLQEWPVEMVCQLLSCLLKGRLKKIPFLDIFFLEGSLRREA